MKDILGREIVLGSIIAYPGRQSSSLWLSVGRVIDTKSVPHPWKKGETETHLKLELIKDGYSWEENPKPRKTWIRETGRVVIVQ